MNSVIARLAAFAVAIVIAFGGAYAAGAAIGPLTDDADDVPTSADLSEDPDHDDEHGG